MRIIAEEKLNIITVVLRSGDEPFLTRPQMQRVVRAHRAHNVYAKYRETLDDSDDDDGPEDDDAWLFEDLKVLTQLYSRLRDREQIIALIFEVSSVSFYGQQQFSQLMSIGNRALLRNC